MYLCRKIEINTKKELDYGGYINIAQYLRGTVGELQQLRHPNENNGW